MSMSSRIVGFKKPDSTFNKMKAVYDACVAAELDIPNEVHDYFEGEPPDKAGVVVDLKGHEAVTDYSAEMSEGFEIDLSLIPKDITIIRFVNSW